MPSPEGLASKADWKGDMKRARESVEDLLQVAEPHKERDNHRMRRDGLSLCVGQGLGSKYRVSLSLSHSLSVGLSPFLLTTSLSLS